MATRALPDLGAGRGEASQELAALLAARAQLNERLDALDLQQREASEARERTSAALSDLERQAAAGQQVTKAEREKRERELTQAKIAHGEPWAERREGLRAAARDADGALGRFISEHLDELLAELHEDADAAAEAIDRAARAVVAAFAERQRVDAAVAALVGRVRPARPGDIARTKAEAVVREANRLLEAGGEAAPRLTVDPRQPRHGAAVAEAEPAA